MAKQKYLCLRDRLLAHSVICAATGCRLWQGAVSEDGYGRITLRVPKVAKRHRRKSTSVTHPKVPRGFWVHRLAYELAKGVKLDPEETLDHKCPGGPRKHCWNEDHMQVVSRSVNTRLAWARRRQFEAGFPVNF